jgi:hypothetical protein
MKVIFLREAYIQTDETKALNWKQTNVPHSNRHGSLLRTSFKTISTFPITVYDEIIVISFLKFKLV